jgi:NDP-sugar pyrophosphorylase family protein
MSGDVITNIRLDEMLEQHETSKALVTDALHEVEDPSRFGAVEIDSASRILRFVEKPHKTHAPSQLINAGIYLINSKVLRMIPSGRKVSLEREIFPVLAKRGKLTGFRASGYWFDIGSLSDYRRANFDLIRRMSRKSIVDQGRSIIARDSKLIPPCIIGRNSKISQGTTAGPNVVLGSNVQLGNRVRVKNSILFDDVEVGEGSSIRGAIIGSNSLIGKMVRIETGAIISPSVHIHDGIKIGRGAVIHPHQEIRGHVKRWTQLM